MNRILNSSLFLALLFLSGCSKPPVDLTPLIAEYRSTFPECEGKEMCEELWLEAKVWLEAHSDLGIDVDIDDLIQTHSLGYKNQKLVVIEDEVHYADERDRVRETIDEVDVDAKRGDYVGPEIKVLKQYIGMNRYRFEIEVACEETGWMACEEALYLQIKFNREMRGETHPFPGSASEDLWAEEAR